jgi:hypothetical protein
MRFCGAAGDAGAPFAVIQPFTSVAVIPPFISGHARLPIIALINHHSNPQNMCLPAQNEPSIDASRSIQRRSGLIPSLPADVAASTSCKCCCMAALTSTTTKKCRSALQSTGPRPSRRILSHIPHQFSVLKIRPHPLLHQRPRPSHFCSRGCWRRFVQSIPWPLLQVPRRILMVFLLLLSIFFLRLHRPPPLPRQQQLKCQVPSSFLRRCQGMKHLTSFALPCRAFANFGLILASASGACDEAVKWMTLGADVGVLVPAVLLLVVVVVVAPLSPLPSILSALRFIT